MGFGRRLIIILLIAFGYAGPSFGKTMPRKLLYAYIDFSSFHGNGYVVWLMQDGTTFIQRAQPDLSRWYEFSLPPAELSEIRKSLDQLAPADLKTHEVSPIPDQVIIRLGYRPSTGEWTSFKVLDQDWKNQSRGLRRLKAIGEKLLVHTDRAKPLSEKTYAPGKLKMEMPPGISEEDVDASFAISPRSVW